MAAIKYTGAGVNLAFGSDEEVTDVYTDQRFDLHLKREEDGKKYTFVKYTAGTATVVAVAGNLVYWTATSGVVVGDESDSKVPAGFLVSVIADTGYGWIQTEGPLTINTSGDDDIALGDLLYATTTDGKVEALDATIFTTTAATLAQVQRALRLVGYALAADSDANNNVAAYVKIR